MELKLKKLGLEEWWERPEKLPLLIAYVLFEEKFKECVELKLPLDEMEQLDLIELI